MSKKVYFNASQVAGAIGMMEPYRTAEEEKEKIWSRYDPESYYKAHPDSQVINIDLCLDYLTREGLEARGIEISEQQKNTISQEKFQEVMQNSEVAQAIQNRQSSIEAIVEGVAQETEDINKYAQNNNRDVSERNSKMYYWTDNNYILGGKIDGMTTDNEGAPVVVENKHRKNRLFNRLRMYERVQLFMYMKLTGAKKAILVENYKNKSATQEVEWIEEEWQMYSDMISAVANEVISASFPKNLIEEPICSVPGECSDPK